MWIVTADRKQIVNSDFVKRFFVTPKPDAVLIGSSFDDGNPAVTLGRYDGMEEANDALTSMLHAVAGGQTYYYMQDSRLFYEEKQVHDARVKRKGGS